ncbi:hypothetical protein [Paenibacillus sp. sgz302251]|uniref:hypothetical protein n=1 Tax=Paenibacillus sp. sgz302251 TaxID=3414493 RepID=UPI003C7DECF3
MNISDKLTAQMLHEIANIIRQKGETVENIDVVSLIEEIKRQILNCCTNHNENTSA